MTRCHVQKKSAGYAISINTHGEGHVEFAFMSHMHKGAARPLSYSRPEHALYALCLLKHSHARCMLLCIHHKLHVGMLSTLCPCAQHTNRTLNFAHWTFIAMKHSKMHCVHCNRDGSPCVHGYRNILRCTYRSLPLLFAMSRRPVWENMKVWMGPKWCMAAKRADSSEATCSTWFS